MRKVSIISRQLSRHRKLYQLESLLEVGSLVVLLLLEALALRLPRGVLAFLEERPVVSPPFGANANCSCFAICAHSPLLDDGGGAGWAQGLRVEERVLGVS